MHTSDENLIYSFLEGEKQAFDELYDRYFKPIYNFIYFKTHHQQTAEDLTTETFMKAFKNLQSFDQKKASFKTWMYRIARNTVIDHYRTQKPTSEDIVDAWGLSTHEDIEQETDIKIRSEEVMKYLEKLKPQHRELILLRLWNNLSFPEIAEISGMSEGNCKVTYSRVIKKMQTELLLFFLFFFSSSL